jgi:hypothetical protein
MLALEDTSTLFYRHNDSKELGHTGVYKQSPSKGMLAHTVLMIDAETKHTIGLTAQHRWCRKIKNLVRRTIGNAVNMKLEKVTNGNVLLKK